MSDTEHAAEAIRLVDMADRSYGQIEHRNGDMAISQQIEAQTLAATAQVHATLHLAEQQRIANLIAIVSLSFGNGASEVTKPWASDADTEAWRGVRDEIAKGLGLSA